jgi:uncharacterized membrane protein
MISDPVAILVVLAAIVYVALQLERRFVLFRSLGGALVAILLGMALSNATILPGNSPTYDFLVTWGVSLAVAFILLSVDLRSIVQAGPKMLAAFGIGAAGTAIGATTAGLLLHGLVGPETYKLAGQFTGTYTGGGANFAALGQALGTSSDMFSAGVAADVAVTAIWMATCLAVPVLLGHSREGGDEDHPALDTPDDERPETLEHQLHSSVRPLPISDMAALVTIAVGSVWASQQLGLLLPFLPDVLWLTTIVLLLAQVPAVQKMAGGALMGNYLLLLFLASNGAQSVIANIYRVGPAVFYFAVGTVAIHGLVVFGAGRLLGLDLGTLAVASQANVGGPASALAMASARGYGDRVLPGVAVGLLGYAAGNYLGFVVASLMRALLLG